MPLNMPIVKDIAHYGTSLLMIALGGAAELGIHLPGVHIDNPGTLFWAGFGILFAGLKGGFRAS